MERIHQFSEGGKKMIPLTYVTAIAIKKLTLTHSSHRVIFEMLELSL